MQGLRLILIVMLLAMAGVRGGEEEIDLKDHPGQTVAAKKILILYFSKTGNTKTLAEKIQGFAGGDMFQIIPKKAYPLDYKTTTEVARVELDKQSRPEVAEYFPVEKIAEYDTIMVGYPIWWGTLPMAYFTFLERYDLAGKTIIPFCTQGGSGLSRSVDDLKKLFPNSTVTRGIAIKGTEAENSDREVKAWLREVGLLKK